MEPESEAASDSESWNSELDDIPLVYDDESCSEASGGHSARSLNSSDTGALNSRTQHSTRQHRLSRESSATSRASLTSAAVNSVGSISLSNIPLKGSDEKAQKQGLTLPGLNDSSQSTQQWQQEQLQDETTQQAPTVSSTKIPRPPMMQLQLPLASANSSSSNEAAPAAVGRRMKLPLPSQHSSSIQAGCAEQCVTAAGSAAVRGKPPPLALLSDNSSTPGSSPQVSGRMAPAKQNSNSTYTGMGALQAFCEKADSNDPHHQQQLVRVQLLLPAVDVYLPLQQPSTESAPKSSGNRSGVSDASGASLKRSSSKLSRVGNSNSSTSPSAAAAADDVQRQCGSTATAEALQLALSKAFGVDAKHLTYFNVQQVQGLQDLLQPQQQQRRASAKQIGKLAAGHPAAKQSADMNSSSSSAEIQVAVGFGAGCSFSLQEMENIVETAQRVAEEAEALRAEKNELQNELIITRLQAAEHRNDLGRLPAEVKTLTEEVDSTRNALLVEQQKTAELQQRLDEAGAEFKRLKLAYEALKTDSGSSSSSPKTVRRQPRTRGESPNKNANAAAAAAAAVPALPIAAAQVCIANQQQQQQQQQQQGKEALVAWLEKPEYASTLTKLLQPDVMEKLTMLATAVDRMPQYYAAAENLASPAMVAAAAAVPLPEQVAAAALTPRSSGSCTPRNAAALHAAAAAAAATTGAERRASSSSGGSTARGKHGSSSKSTPRSGNAAAGSSNALVAAACQQQGTPRADIVTPRTAVGWV